MIKLRTKTETFGTDIEYSGPATYRLFIVAGKIFPVTTSVYVGETENFRGRMIQYCNGSSHIEDKIQSAVKNGQILCVTYSIMPTKEAAEKEQNRWLGLHPEEFPWNTQGKP